MGSQVPDSIKDARTLVACQVRAARAMLKVSIGHLAEESGISESSLRRIEAVFGRPDNVSTDLLIKLQGHFEQRGFRFLWQDGAPGVVWNDYPGPGRE